MSHLLETLLTPEQRREAAAADAFEALRRAQAAHPRLQAEAANEDDDDGGDETSMQPLGFASVLVCFRIDVPDVVTVTGAMVGGDFVDEAFFAPRVVSDWAEAIRLEIAQDKQFASWGE